MIYEFIVNFFLGGGLLVSTPAHPSEEPGLGANRARSTPCGWPWIGVKWDIVTEGTSTNPNKSMNTILPLMSQHSMEFENMMVFEIPPTQTHNQNIFFSFRFFVQNFCLFEEKNFKNQDT